jgi:hypothetical protein
MIGHHRASILQQAALGVRDLNGLKSSAFEKLATAA